MLRRSLLLLHACRLHLAAQRLRRSQSLDRVSRRMLSMRWLPSAVEPAAAVRTAVLVAAGLRRLLGFRNTCLLRSLVAAAILSDRDAVVVNVGLRPPGSTTPRLTGHAWLTVEGHCLADSEPDREAYEEILSLPMRRPR